MLLVVKTHRLQKFLDGTVVIPPSNVSDNGGYSIENLEFVRYEQQDAIISAWLLSTVSLVLYNRLIGDSTSASVLWFALNKIFESQSEMKALRYRSLLHNK